jgi:hypothetical protein
MAGRHKAQPESLTIIRTTEIKGDLLDEVKKPYSRQVLRDTAIFPIIHKRIRPAKKQYSKVFHAKRPNLFA